MGRSADPRDNSNKRHVKGTLAAIAAVVALLAGCATSRDTRTPEERDRDAQIWTRAHQLRVAAAPEQLRGCAPLGVVRETYHEDLPSDPEKRPMDMTWPEYVLRLKTAQLGGNAAVIRPGIEKWKEDWPDQSRVLGEAFLCRQPIVRTASSRARS